MGWQEGSRRWVERETSLSLSPIRAVSPTANGKNHSSVTPLSRRRQLDHPDEVVGRGCEVGVEARSLGAAVTRLAKTADGLHPAPDLLDLLSRSLAETVSIVLRRAAVDVRTPTAHILRDMWRDTARA